MIVEHRGIAPRYVFGIHTEGKSRAEQYHEMMERYTRGLAAHRQDRILLEGGKP